MKDLANSLTTHSVQSQVRQSMQHVPTFQLNVDLPECLLSKLEELDRVVAARQAKRASTFRE